MSCRLEIVEGLHMPSGKLCYAVIDNDGYKYEQHGLFYSRDAAESAIKDLKQKFDDGEFDSAASTGGA